MGRSRYRLVYKYYKRCTHSAFGGFRWQSMVFNLGNRNGSLHSGNTYLCAIYGFRWARTRLKSPKMAFNPIYNMSDIFCVIDLINT